MPFPSNPAQPVEPYQIDAKYLSNGTATANGTFTIPDKGIWLIEVAVSTNNTNNLVIATAIVTWYMSVLSVHTRKTAVLSTALSDGGEVTGLTLSDPSTAGAITATVTWSGGANRTPRLNAIALRLTDNMIAGF